MAVIIAAALIVRAVVIGDGSTLRNDPDNYLPLARSLADGIGFVLSGRPTAYRPPLYPILLAPIVRALPDRALSWGIAALHLALGSGTVALIGWTARRWGLSPVRALVAAAIGAFDPVLVVQARSVMTETPAAFLVALTLAGLTIGGYGGVVLGGLGLGLASFCRPSLLPSAIVIAVAGMAVGPGSIWVRSGRSALLVGVTAAALAPWAWRNARVLGEPIWTTTHGGYTLALANNPVYYADVLDGPPGAVWSGPNQRAWFDSVGPATAGMTEPQADRALRDQALRMARDHPRAFARASAARLGRFWGLAPSGAVYPPKLRLATAAWTLPFWIAAAAGLTRPALWRWPTVAAPSVVVALTMVHLAYWTDLRMRAPLVPALALIAAGAWARSPGQEEARGSPSCG